MKDLIPLIRKDNFAPEVDPSELIDDEAEFQALNGIDWTAASFQPLGGEEEAEPTPDDPSTSHQHGNET